MTPRQQAIVLGALDQFARKIDGTNNPAIQRLHAEVTAILDDTIGALSDNPEDPTIRELMSISMEIRNAV